MRRFFQLFIDIALWRKGPQDLPASTSLLAMVLIWYVSISYIQVRWLGFTTFNSLLLTIIDIGVLMIWLTVVLSILGLRPRLTQALTAMLGVGSLLTLLDVVVVAISSFVGGSRGNLNIWDLMRLTAILLTYGRILATTTERSLFTGMALTFAMLVLVISISHPLLPTLVTNPGP
jgi:hypothetical protein